VAKRKVPTQRKPISAPIAVRSHARSLALVAGVLALAAAAGWWWRWRDVAPVFVHAAEQNVLLITIDTLRGDALRVYGGRAATPNLDRLANEGLRFTFAHSHAVMTLPSHASILTGRYPFDHRVRDNAGFRLPDSVRTLAEAAKDRGLATGAFVGAFPLDRQFGLAQGFETYDDLGGRQVAPSDFAFSERPAAEVVSRATAWIRAQQKPWLAWVHVFDPHSPYEPPQPFKERYAGNLYAGEVAYTDQSLGPLLELVRNSSRPTTIVVTADHGEGLGDHGEATHGVFAYESTLRVPLIVAQVGPLTSAGRSKMVEVPVRHIDVVPTIAEILGLEMPSDLPGRSLLTAEAEPEPRSTYFEAMTAMLKRGWAPLRGVIAGREKYIDLPIDELYNLEKDPLEISNLVGTSPQEVRTMTARLNDFGAAMPGAQADETAEVRARLQSLGYLSGSAPRKAEYTEDDDPKKLVSVDYLMMSGIELHRSGRSAEAIEAYRRVIERRPGMGLAYRRLAYIQWETGATTEAIATLRKDIERNGASVETEVRLGTYLAESGNASTAIPMLEKATKADPGNLDGLNALGIAYSGVGRQDEALLMFERILSVDPRDAFALENIGTVHLQQPNTVAARDAFTRALQNNPMSSRANAGLGVVAMHEGRRDDAIGHWRRAVDLDPRNFDALFNLAIALADAGRMEEARPYISRFVSTAPEGIYGRDIERLRSLLR
jgi:arylsulfatase A-like enzyme/Tfp pilus assembly protein PilF